MSILLSYPINILFKAFSKVQQSYLSPSQGFPTKSSLVTFKATQLTYCVFARIDRDNIDQD